MKNVIKSIFRMLLLVFAFQFVSACSSSHHNPYNDLSVDDGIILVVQQVPADNYNNHEWENEDRYPVYDYRYGYSYRAMPEYQYREEDYKESHSNNDEYRSDYSNHYSYDDQSNNYYSDYQQTPYVYYTNDDYMRTYTPHECYVNPPHDKVFYIKCP